MACIVEYDSVGIDPRLSISNKFPGDAAAGLTTL